MKLMIRTHLLHYYCFAICSLFGTLHAGADIMRKPARNIPIEPYLLPQNHALHETLTVLLQDPHMFDSPRQFKDAGFSVKEGHRHLMVGFHPLLPKYAIKKFTDAMSSPKQIENYVKRIEGAEVLRMYIQEHNFKHLVVPRKWIYQLPSHFSKKHATYVLIVENMNIYDDWDNPHGEARSLYYHMDRETLTELCTILYDVGGCDAFPWNQPFTHSGKIAFIDTEHVGKRKFHDYFIENIVPALNKDLQAYALALWEKLKNERRPAIF